MGYSSLPGNRGDDTAAFYDASPNAGGALWMDKTPAGRVVRFNGKEMGEAYDDVQLVTFSADGRHVIFIGKRSRLWHVVVDGQETAKAYKSVDSIYLSPDGQRTIVVAARDDKTYVLVNGQEQSNTYGGLAAFFLS